jgi:hypothetical protein
MKWVSALVVLLLLIPAMASSQTPGSIGLFGDEKGTTCDVYDIPALVTIYVFHLWSPGTTGAQFKVDCNSWGADMTFIGQNSPYLTIGDAREGVAIAYGSCLVSPILILELHYVGSGTSATCSYCQVVADPGAVPTPGILVADCSDPPLLFLATGGDVVINPDASCMCDIPVEEASWGRIKSLYK